ncbi:MAG: 4-hydroxy-tetrahydrodipicolinate synthase [Gammaproteobacteria bacterium RIFOXYA12_FULL_61_12]|nr:MAG: 4-hydroxy-tetrahydrodipicolinate synthase [Gammaproteobacteria bacterium RIFOXYD12_FULL_61_37]OGT93639.1 MAG: 4-hydroxy-tetrahydrodipicolinate synthase [Gammaproteobacteria bacterium RIFOXYA12_FULL_61_12]
MIQGSLVALVTPMAVNGDVDFDCLRRLVDWHVQQGTDGIVSVGTTGESSTLNEQEHCEVIRRTIEFVAGRVPVIAGTGANSTAEAIHLTRRAKELGADACLLVTPYYNKPTQEGLYLHYRAVAEAVEIPQILYNVPGRTACDMKPETVGRLAELQNIIGIKEATGDLSRVAVLRGLCGDSFALYSGDDATALEFILRGGNGVISVTANLVPSPMHRMCMAAIGGDRGVAQDIDNGIAPLHLKLFVESNPIPVKWALAEMGMIPPGIRLPLTPLSEPARPAVRDAMAQAGLL